MQEARNILIADDEDTFRESTADVLKQYGYHCHCVPDGFAAVAALQEKSFDLLIADINMPGNQNMELVDFATDKEQHVPIIIVTGYPSLETAIQSVRSPTVDYFVKPFEISELLKTIQKTISARSARAPNPNREPDRQSINQMGIQKNGPGEWFPAETPGKAYDTGREEADRFDEIIGRSAVMKKLFKQIKKIAQSNANVFIHGESGTGKELFARAIHRHSLRSAKSFVPVDTVALPTNLLESELFGYEKGAFTGATTTRRGLLEYADHGTLFLDEISELDPYLQVKLLRVIQEREFRRIGSNTLIKVDLRLISATNMDPSHAVQDGQLREDLFYRLSVIPVKLPPLRERKEDIPLLLKHYINKICRFSMKGKKELSSDALRVMQEYTWPGNVRELINLVERLVSMIDDRIIQVAHLPEYVLTGTTEEAHPSVLPYAKARAKMLRRFDEQYFGKMLEMCNGNISKAARIAKVNRKTLYRKMQSNKK